MGRMTFTVEIVKALAWARETADDYLGTSHPSFVASADFEEEKARAGSNSSFSGACRAASRNLELVTRQRLQLAQQGIEGLWLTLKVLPADPDGVGNPSTRSTIHQGAEAEG